MKEHPLTNVRTIFTKLVVTLKFFSLGICLIYSVVKEIYEVQSYFNIFMKVMSLSDVEQKYLGIFRGAENFRGILGENYLIYCLIKLASDTISTSGCILR